MQVQYTQRAFADLADITTFIALDNPPMALEVYYFIKDLIDTLGENPYIGRAGRVTKTRELVIVKYSYTVVYEIGEDTIWILGVFHDRQHHRSLK